MKKYARAEAEHGFAKREILRHLQLGKAHVHAVEISDHVAQHQERHDAPEHFRVGTLDFGGRRQIGSRCRRNRLARYGLLRSS